MDKKVVGFLGAAAALTSMTMVQADAAPVAGQTGTPAARSYAELLEPVPDARARMNAEDAAQVEQTQYAIIRRRHHHHHHHHHRRHIYGVLPPYIYDFVPPRHHRHHHHDDDRL